MTEFGDYSQLTADGLVFSSSKRRIKNGTYRFWSPQAYRPYYIYTTGTRVRKVASKSDLLEESTVKYRQGRYVTVDNSYTWTHAVEEVLKAHGRHRSKVDRLLEKSVISPGDEVSFMELDELYVFQKQKKGARRRAAFKVDPKDQPELMRVVEYIDKIRERWPNAHFVPSIRLLGREVDEDWLRAEILDGSSILLCGGDRGAAQRFLMASFRNIQWHKRFALPGMESNCAIWTHTHHDPSTWEKKEP